MCRDEHFVVVLMTCRTVATGQILVAGQSRTLGNMDVLVVPEPRKTRPFGQGVVEKMWILCGHLSFWLCQVNGLGQTSGETLGKAQQELHVISLFAFFLLCSHTVAGCDGQGHQADQGQGDGQEVQARLQVGRRHADHQLPRLQKVVRRKSRLQRFVPICLRLRLKITWVHLCFVCVCVCVCVCVLCACVCV